jgi:GMP synthase PP-ATPase subunit
MTLPIQRSAHGDLTSRELADRLAIRELVDAYAHCADRRDVEGQMSLFLGKLEGVDDPEKKRKIIGATFIDVFDEEVSSGGGVT